MAVIEIASFDLAPGVSPAHFLAVDGRVGAEYVSRQPGFISRETAHDGASWIVVVHWVDVASADGSMVKYGAAAAAQEQMSLMAPGTSSMRRYTVADDS